MLIEFGMIHIICEKIELLLLSVEIQPISIGCLRKVLALSINLGYTMLNVLMADRQLMVPRKLFMPSSLAMLTSLSSHGRLLTGISCSIAEGMRGNLSGGYTRVIDVAKTRLLVTYWLFLTGIFL